MDFSTLNFDPNNSQASTITMTSTLTANVNIQLAYELLPILHPRNPNGTRFIHPINTRNKIPYFGVENAVVCVKYKGRIRGIRQNTGQMNNVASIDLQTGNKNVNIKLARTQVQLTGANSEEMGENSFRVMCSHINMIQSHLNHIRSLDEEVRQNTINWVAGKAFEILSDNPESDLEYRLHYLSMSTIEKESSIYNIDTTFASFLWNFAEDYDIATDYSEAFKNIVKICYDVNANICDNYVDITECNIQNSVYNYNINQEVSLIGLAQHLSNKGFSVSFHNWNSTPLKVSIPIYNDSASETSDETTESDGIRTVSINSSGKIKVHRFTVHRKLSVKQTSPTNSTQAAEARNSFLEGVADFLSVC